FGGRNRTPSTKFQEFQEVLEEVKAKNFRRGGGRGSGGGGGSGSGSGGRGSGRGGASRMDTLDEAPSPSHQHYSARQPRTENGTFTTAAARAKHGAADRAAPPQATTPEDREKPTLTRERLLPLQVAPVVAPKRPPGRPPNKSHT
ncbi:unnamed protein product, partial [Laminaria digitata]